MVSMKFNRRKKTLKSAMSISVKEVVPVENTYAEPVAEPVAAPPAETRDEKPFMERLVDDASSVISNALSEVSSMANDVKDIIVADVPEIKEVHFDGIPEEASQGEDRYDPENKVTGGPEKLAKLVKDLGPKERKMEQLGQEFVKAQEDVRNQRKMIQALSAKLNFEAKKSDKNDNDDVSDDVSDAGSVVDEIVRFGRGVEDSATKAFFPHGEMTV